jgi:Asp-tRNA(Asn)/Glu-tRNA(Gln) amidotransferase A subunit family amidase
VPTGLQIATRAFDDLAAFQVAAAFNSGAPTFFKDDLLPDFRGAE